MTQKIFLCFLIAAGVLMLSTTDGYSYPEYGNCQTVVECANCHSPGGIADGVGHWTFCEYCPSDPTCTTPTTLPPATTTTTTLPPATTTTNLPPATTTTLAPTTTTTTLPSEDLCPDDPNKTDPGVCGCGRIDYDFDSDGIADCLDNAPYDYNPPQIDTDLDGVGDAAETGLTFDDPSVASLTVNYGHDRVTLSTDGGNSLENVSTLPTDQVGDLPAGVTFPFDFLEFSIITTPGGAVTITLKLPVGEEPTTYWKYDVTPLDGDEFLYDGTTGAEFNGNVITLHFVDGERGDYDLAANGIIDDPGGPALLAPTTTTTLAPTTTTTLAPTTTTTLSDATGCFIATAAYGSYTETHVMTLRQFRDSFLLTNRLGTTLVEAYYKYSPPMASYIAQHSGLRSAVRVGLTPLVGFSWLAMNYGMMFALTMLFSMLAIIIGVAFFILKIREAN